MSNYWSNFIATGDPNGNDLPTWTTFRDAPDQVMRSGTTSAMRPRPHAAAVAFWQAYTGPGI
jgi:para-nitrobenzyl esterase